MTPPRTRRHRLACAMITAALAAASLVAAAPQTRAAGAGDDAQAAADRCAKIPPGLGHPPLNLTPVTLQVLQPSIEPVPATDGLIHLAYVAQATNTQATPADITGVVPVDPLAGFAPTGRNLIVDSDEQGRSVAGKVKLFAASPGGTLPADGPEPAQPVPAFTTRVPAGGAGLMFFDVTYTDPAQVPRLLAHAITLASPTGGPGAPGLTNPVPVGCKALAVLRPPLVGRGWAAFNGCCTVAAYHRDAVPPLNGAPQTPEQFAIDYIQLGPNNTCCNGPPEALGSWLGYGTPVLAAAPGVVVEVVDGLPDQQPVGTVSPDLPIVNYPGNHVVEDIGGGRYVTYAHLQPGSIPAAVRKGARLGAGDPVGRVGNSGNSDAPHLHFQVQDSPSPLDAAGLPFVFDTQLFEGTVVPSGDPVSGLSIDRTGAGVRDGLMPARNGVFGYNLSP
jgi:Peptidase family M23